ncbi:MAG: hypothetical protein IJ906_08345 [Oscillospiraceae bacterium]|nr:hypothetical protein [Oscillospiraceae bacterium]
MKKALTACISCLLLASTLSLPVHAELTEPSWQLGINDWGFYGIGTGTDVSEADREKLRSQLKNTELYTAETVLARTKAGGGCYGKAVTSILSAYGLIDYSLYTHENGTVPRGLADIGFPYLSDKGDISDVTVPSAALSLIQYYHCLQCTDEFRQYRA